MATVEKLTSFKQVRLGDYCLVSEDGRPKLGQVCEIPGDRNCVYYKWKGDDRKTYTRGITDPRCALVVRQVGKDLLVLIGENYNEGAIARHEERALLARERAI